MSFCGESFGHCKALVVAAARIDGVLSFRRTASRGAVYGRMTLGQVDSKRVPRQSSRWHRNVAVMVADHRLHDGQPPAPCLQLGVNKE